MNILERLGVMRFVGVADSLKAENQRLKAKLSECAAARLEDATRYQERIDMLIAAQQEIRRLKEKCRRAGLGT